MTNFSSIDLVTESSTERKCPQCNVKKPWPGSFFGARGLPIRWCEECRLAYAKGGKPNRAGQRKNLPTDGPLVVSVVQISQNLKLGRMPSTITSAVTCPPSCSFFGNGCYAEFHRVRVNWERVEAEGMLWTEFLQWVCALPDGQVWRHNEAGDLPGNGDKLNIQLLNDLVYANIGRRGFTFTHKPLHTHPERVAIWTANKYGFTINWSADNLEDADRKMACHTAPVVVVLPIDAPNQLRTPDGHRVVVCPAQTHDGMSCAKCQLCTRVNRKCIVGFRAHGQAKKQVNKLVQLRRSADG